MMDIYLKVALHEKIRALIHNKIVTTFVFILLITSILFIELHPYSVWYYFFAGFFCCRMLELICEKTALKFTIDNLLQKLRSL